MTSPCSRVLQLEEKTGQRHRGGQRYQLTLLHALKPHSQAITCLAVHPHGQIVASGVSVQLAQSIYYTYMYTFCVWLVKS